MKTKTALVLCLTLCLWMGIGAKALAQPPDIRGTYQASATSTWENCQDPADNGTFVFSGFLVVPRQEGESFSGFAIVTAVIGGIDFRDGITFSGTVTDGGELSGRTADILLENFEFDSYGESTFAGQLVGNMLELNFSGQDLFGDTCTFMGSLSATRLGA